MMKYVVFKTKRGWFGLAADANGLVRTCLPHSNRLSARNCLLKDMANPHYDANLFKNLQRAICDYFAGKKVDFSSDIAVSLGGVPPFSRRVLTFCRKIDCGRTVTYAQLAAHLGKPGAGRAVGNALARNPAPLVIPCHRVLRSDGSLGGFSAPGGTRTKAMMLELESSGRKGPKD